jgi:hypothetical protein
VSTEYENLMEKRRRKLTNIALHIAENENHPVHKLLRDQEVYDEYALRGKLYKLSLSERCGPEYGRVCDQQQL